ncbi:DUF3300 domain-containing protein [Pseudomonadota bacterium]
MRKLLAISGKLLFLVVLCMSLGSAQAQDAAFSEEQLDQMMAPIALYPDSLLAQILMASTYPADVAEAVQWSKDNPDQEGDAAVEAVQDKTWDPSVMSLVAFPQVLAMMGEQPDWVQNVGDAFLADSETVMDTVQKLRSKAKDEGNLETTEQQTVTVEEQSSAETATSTQTATSTETIIIIEPANPQVVYVPYYNPTIIYGPWWWPRYTPWYYRPYGYGFGGAVVRGIGFGIGVGITRSLWGGCHWGHGRGGVNINVNKYNNINRNKINSNNRNSNWSHNSNNRRGVPYKDQNTRDKFDNKRDGASSRENYRGRDAQRDQARNTLDKRGVSPSEGRKDLKGAGGDKARSSVNKANRDVTQGKAGNRQATQGQAGNRQATQGQAGNRATGQNRNTSQTRNTGQSRSRSSALTNSGNANRTRQSVNRGQSSNRSMGNRGGGRRR